MKAYLTRRYWFSASHRLHCSSMSPEENRSVYGKCNNPHGHGHNYALEVTVSGQVDGSTGMICNLVDLDAFVDDNTLGISGTPEPSTFGAVLLGIGALGLLRHHRGRRWHEHTRLGPPSR